MNKTEILNIVNEPSKHIQIVKIDGKDSIVYSSKFVELLELIPTMLTKDDMVSTLTELMVGIVDHIMPSNHTDSYDDGWSEGAEWCVDYIQEHINTLKGVEDGNDD